VIQKKLLKTIRQADLTYCFRNRVGLFQVSGNQNRLRQGMAKTPKPVSLIGVDNIVSG
jgi:hypothetical protein